MTTQTIKVNATDSITFLDNVQEVVKRGATRKQGTYVYLNSIPFMAEFEVEVGEIGSEWTDNGPHIFAIPVEYPPFTKEQLEALPWEDFKRVLFNTKGIKGRDRLVMQNQYLKATNQI